MSPSLLHVGGGWGVDLSELRELSEKLAKMADFADMNSRKPGVRLSSKGRFYLKYGTRRVYISVTGKYFIESRDGLADGNMADGFPDILK